MIERIQEYPMNKNKDIYNIVTFYFKDDIKVKDFNIKEFISSEHDTDCCEYHALDFEHIDLNMKTLEEQLVSFNQIEIKWIKWMWVSLRFYDWYEWFSILIPWRWYNNWYYSNELILVINIDWNQYRYDITDCQDY